MHVLPSRLAIRALTSRQNVLDAAFFLGVPLVLALTMAAVGRHVDVLGLTGGLFYVAALSFVPWWIAGITTHIACLLLRPLAPPLWLVTTLGVLLSTPFVSLYAQELNQWFHAAWAGGHLLRELSWPDSIDRVRDLLLSTGRAIVLWTAFVIAFTSTFGWTRYHRANDVPAAAGSDEPVAVPVLLRNSGSSWRQDDDAALCALVRAGVPLKSIASRLQRTVPAIRSRMAKLGLRFPDA
jgi:hypothetical protein